MSDGVEGQLSEAGRDITNYVQSPLSFLNKKKKQNSQDKKKFELKQIVECLDFLDSLTLFYFDW